MFKREHALQQEKQIAEIRYLETRYLETRYLGIRSSNEREIPAQFTLNNLL